MTYEVDMDVTPVYLANAKAFEQGYRIIANQGGTRSGKTYAIMQLLSTLVKKLNNTSITVTSVALPHLKRGALRDFNTILGDYNWYNEADINKTDLVYNFGSNYIEFFSSDNSLKVRGPGRDILFVNEANLLDYATFKQLLLRTTKTIFIDYNPADEYHWIYDHVLNRADCKFIQSTYLESYDFLAAEQIQEIELLKDESDDLWRVFGLGERGSARTNIYTHWKVCESLPALDRYCYGLDFGFGHPTALVQCRYYNNANYWHEVIYGSGITTNDLIAKMKELMIDRRVEIFADSARSDTIEEIYRAGFNIKKADKTVTDGILFIKSKPLYITRESTNLLKEIRSYKWMEDKNGRILDAPVKLFDDGMDAGRYGSYTFNKPAFKIKTHNT